MGNVMSEVPSCALPIKADHQLRSVGLWLARYYRVELTEMHPREPGVDLTPQMVQVLTLGVEQDRRLHITSRDRMRPRLEKDDDILILSGSNRYSPRLVPIGE